MSVYSRAISDSARCIFTLDSGYIGLAGTQSALASNVTYTGTPAIFSHVSLSGGNGSFTFDGSTQGLYATQVDPLRQVGSDHTIEAIFKTTHNTSTQKYIWRIPSGGVLSLNSTKLEYISSNGTSSTIITASPSLVNDGQWHHVVCRRLSVGSNTTTSIWVDGVKVAQSGNSFFGSFPNANNIYIAQFDTTATSTDKFNGSIDFVATYGTGLTDTKIGEHYADFLAAKNSYVEPAILPYNTQISSLNPKVWYNFNETAGTPTNSGSLSTTATYNGLLLNEESDVNGRSVYFDGSNAYISLNAWPSFSLFNDKSFTVETWFKSVSPFQGTLFRFSGVNPVSNHLTINLMPSGDANQNKLQLDFIGLGEQTADRITYSPNTYNDNKWHHVVVAVNTTSLKWYIDGQLITVKTLTTGTLDWDNYVSGNGYHRLIGTGRSYVSDNLSTTKFRGRIDEFALYPVELTAGDILKNFNSGASVAFDDMAGFATALAVMPTLTADGVHNAAPMTASALFVETLPSNFDYVDGIQKIISDLSPDQWIKFDSTTDVTRSFPAGFLTNYGSGGTPTFSAYAVGDAYKQLGPAQEPRLELRLGAGTSGATASGYATTTTSGFFSTEVSDNDCSIGIWFKMPSGIDTSDKQIFGYSGGTNSAINLKISNKKVQFNVTTSHTTYTHTETNDISENVWHLAVIRLDLANTTLKYYLDGTQVFSDTAVQGTRNTPTTFQFGKNAGNGTDTNTKFQEIAHFFVSSYSAATPTVITNLWNAGNRQNQAKGVMTFPILKFQNKYDDYVDSLNPIQKLGFNELSGTFLENTGSNANSGFTIQGTSYTRGTSVPTKNRYGYNFTNKNTYVSGGYSVATGNISDNTLTISVYAKQPTVTGSDVSLIALWGAGNTAQGSGIGLVIGANASGPYLGIVPTTNPATWYTLSSGSTSYFGDWHLYTAVRDGSATRFYIDGKLVASGTYSAYNSTDFGFAAIGGGETVWLGAAAATVNKYIDEFASFDYALSAQQIFEMWQSIEIDRMNATTAEFVMPTNIAGTGNIYTTSPMTASGELVEPGQTDEINLFPGHLEAHSEFLHPNYGGNVVIDANYGHTAAIASAEFHDPQYNIGENNGAASMDASALMIHPIAIGGGTIAAPTAVAQDAILVMPGIITIKGARVFAEPAISKAFFPLPPAYLQLTDDQWYVRLYGQHATQNIEAAFVTGNLPNTPTTQVAKTYLKFFEDVTSPITVGNGYLENNLEEKLFLSPGSTNTTKTKVYPSIASSLTPTPALYTGYYDDFSRKAVRVNNIEFALPEEIYKSKEQFSLEFSIKTTKANQIIAQGKWSSFLYYQRDITGLGLYNGKLYLMNTNTTAGVPGNRTPHPANPDVVGSNLILGRTNIADGKWHHVVVQVGFGDNRMQFWVDGKLDIQKIGGAQVYSRLYILGSNNSNTTYQADFETSAWSYDKQEFLSEQNISLNYIGYLKYEPIKAEPMKATITMTDKNTAAGNRGRAIVFYFWPEETSNQIAPNPPVNSIRGGKTLAGVSTDDFFKQPPQEWYGWDMYPVDVTGRYVSELVKPEAYGVENIKIQTPSFPITTASATRDPLALSYKVNSNGYFRDPITDDRRYIDVFNDIDLSQFDAIFFKNYPEETFELDTYARDEFVDQYFNLREKEIFEQFLVSLRKGLDTGISLFVTNHQLAIDLGIIDRVEVVSNMTEEDFTSEDAYVTATAAATGINAYDTGWYPDLAKNNKHRVINTLENLTNEAGYIWKDWFFFQNDSTLDFGGPDRPYTKIEYRPNGLQIGDEFIISDDSIYGSIVKATPFANVKAGKIITAFGNNVLQNNTAIENPYKNYATSIAVEPGTILKGKPTVGKIFVNFTERFQYDWDGRDASREYMQVDLIQDEFINAAYNDGEITLAKRNELLTSADNLDRKLEAAIAAGNQTLINQIVKQKYWTGNGEYIIAQKKIIEDVTGAGVEKDGIGKGVRKGRVGRLNKKGALSTQTISSTSTWFTFEYSWIYPRQQFVVASMLTRGIRWLSDRVIDDGTVVRTEAAKNLSATLPMPVVTADKDKTYYAQAMFANARIIHAPGYTLASVSNTPLPLFADAKFGDFVKNIAANVFTATANFRQDVRTVGIQEDEIVLYIMHVDPIVYLREEVIK